MTFLNREWEKIFDGLLRRSFGFNSLKTPDINEVRSRFKDFMLYGKDNSDPIKNYPQRIFNAMNPNLKEDLGIDDESEDIGLQKLKDKISNYDPKLYSFIEIY